MKLYIDRHILPLATLGLANREKFPENLIFANCKTHFRDGDRKGKEVIRWSENGMLWWQASALAPVAPSDEKADIIFIIPL